MSSFLLIFFRGDCCNVISEHVCFSLSGNLPLFPVPLRALRFPLLVRLVDDDEVSILERLVLPRREDGSLADLLALFILVNLHLLAVCHASLAL